MTLYLDHAATTPGRPQAMAAFQAAGFGNPSGIHRTARDSKNHLEDAREQAATLIGASSREIVFTGGGSESDNLAVIGAMLASDLRLVVSPVEHDAVIESARFVERLGHDVKFVSVDHWGRVDPVEIAAATEGRPSVVSVMLANNETGVIEPVRAVADVAHARGAIVHTDAVQAFVSEDVDVDELGVDMLTLAAHKFGGPKGVGLLYVRSGTRLEPLVHGGGQEWGLRSGTQNVPGIVAMVAAMHATVKGRERFRTDVGEARRRFENRLVDQIEGLEINAPVDARLVQHSHVRIPGVRNDVVLIRLDQEGVAASAGSACQSGAADVSHVLSAMGFDAARARECFRFTFGWTTLPEDGDTAADAVLRAIGGER
ncbi:MAG: cysteine desulfurase family protein [Acidimicrobiia bacterium]